MPVQNCSYKLPNPLSLSLSLLALQSLDLFFFMHDVVPVECYETRTRAPVAWGFVSVVRPSTVVSARDSLSPAGTHCDKQTHKNDIL